MDRIGSLLSPRSAPDRILAAPHPRIGRRVFGWLLSLLPRPSLPAGMPVPFDSALRAAPARRRLLALILPAAMAAAAAVATAQAQDRTQDRTLGAAAAEDLQRAAVRVEAVVPSDATSTATLGTRRAGNGIVIGEDGLILTIGYLILEAMTVDVTDHSGRRLPAEIVVYDFNSGFGLLRALVPLDAAPLQLGVSADLAVGDRAIVVGHGSAGGLAPATVTARREFSGGWEYLLDSAIYTTPPFREFGGAGLVDASGRLVGIGSLAVGQAGPETGPGRRPLPGNVFVPIDLLPPILQDLRAARRGGDVRHPWLGMNTVDVGPGLLVQRVTPDGPAARAGITPGDVVMALNGEPVENQANFYRKVWALGDPGVEVDLQVMDGRRIRTVRLRSADRYDFLKLDPSL